MRCDIFCRVIDNFGDIGVCWRLARQLHTERGVEVRLIVDDLHSFARLAPSLSPGLDNQVLQGITVQRWHQSLAQPADLVIEAFACDIPHSYQTAMATLAQPPVWINLEYLSAEDWVEGCHGLSSMHPQLGLSKTFWFPGFTPRTGGLLREATLPLATRSPNPERVITLFGYEQPALASLLDALSQDMRLSRLNVFAGRSLSDVTSWLGRPLQVGDAVQRGQLHIQVLDFLPPEDFDALLAASDLNLVRGEDSFVRAQLAGQPMLWHIYTQEEEAHLAKLKAWMQRLQAEAGDLPHSWQQRQWDWNVPELGAALTATDWRPFLQDLPAIQVRMHAWREQLLAQDDLATQLMRFYANQVESSPVVNPAGNPTP